MEKLTFEKLAFDKPFILYCVLEDHFAYKSSPVIMLPPYKCNRLKNVKGIFGRIVDASKDHGPIRFKHGDRCGFICNVLTIKQLQSKSSYFQYNDYTRMFLNREDAINFLKQNFAKHEKLLKENIRTIS